MKVVVIHVVIDVKFVVVVVVVVVMVELVELVLVVAVFRVVVVVVGSLLRHAMQVSSSLFTHLKTALRHTVLTSGHPPSVPMIALKYCIAKKSCMASWQARVEKASAIDGAFCCAAPTASRQA